MQRGLPWNLVLIWLVASTLAVLAGSLLFHAAHWNGEYLPLGNDSYYHARRILDTVRDPSSFYEFDARIHAPEGSLLTWPWAYDYAMAMIARAGMALGLSDNPMAILIWVPVFSVSLSVAFLMAIARQLGLSVAMTTLAALCIAVSPTTQQLHGAGLIDHHYAEFIFILGALAAGLAWLREPQSARRAAATAVVLGLGPAIQNGLFILQLPLLVTLFVLWLQGRSVPSRKSGVAFALTLLLTTTAILLPSLPFRLGHFEFYTLSWFHLYIAACSAVTVGWMSRLQPTRIGVVASIAVSCVLLVPILNEVAIARSFIAGTSRYLRLITEMQPPLAVAEVFGTVAVAAYYSHLIWIAPLGAAVCAFKCYQERATHRLLFWISSLMGLALLASQMRMHYFGNFALYLPWLVLLQEFCDKYPRHVKKAVLIGGLALLLVYYPPLRYQLGAPMATANDMSFRETRPILASLSKACAEDPGVVLADTDLGHYIRYYTDCSVIANNFLLTPQHLEKVEELQALNALTAREFVAKAPDVKYVLARPDSIAPREDGSLEYQFLVDRPRLPLELLHSPADSLPLALTLLDEVRLPSLNDAIFARLYKFDRGAGAATLSANSGKHPTLPQ